jgi:amino acid adenylation domain-containing protein
MTLRPLAIDKADGRSLRSGFLRHAAATPDAPALVLGEVTRSYGQMEQTARVWAQGICDLLDGPAGRVGIFAARNEVAYTGTLAALFSGAAFVPLNPAFPLERTSRMIQAADLDAIVVDSATARAVGSALSALDAPPPVIAPEDEAVGLGGVRTLTRPDLASLPPLDRLPPVLPHEVAYLLFTSGSTGVPKGVPVTHANVLHFLDVVTARYDISEADRFSQTFDQTFDLSVFDLFAAWERGARVCAMQPIDLLAPGRFIQRHGVTVWFSVPSLPALLRRKNLLKPSSFPTLRWSLFCGEPLPRATAEAWQAAAPNSVVENLYGPTELTIACFVHRWNPAQSPALCLNEVVPIGRPYEGLGVLILDESLQPVADGEAGELCVCGPQTVPGYWKAPAQTEQRFVPVPLPGGLATRFYRTGDRVRRLPEGEYVYLGRTDHQIKVLGHRVELGEIEAVLAREDGVTQAVALGWPVADNTAEGIVAFVCGRRPDAGRLKAAARQALPEYMAPRAVFVLDEMPLNANGKIDRAALLRRLDAEPAGKGQPAVGSNP